MRYFTEPIIEPITYPCGICFKTVAKNHRFIKCTLCNNKIHMKCNEIDVKTYTKLVNEESNIFCLKYNEDLLPFYSTKKDEETRSHPQSTSFSQNLVNFLNQITENTEDYNEIYVEGSPPVDCSDYDRSAFKCKKAEGNISFQNIATLGGHKDELENILFTLKHKFDVIAITETTSALYLLFILP